MEAIPAQIGKRGASVDREDEKNLIRLVKAGNYRQFERIIEKYQRALFLFIWRMVRDEDDAKDLCQDTFFKAYKSIKSFREEAKFSSWLFQIGYRKSLDLIAKRKRRSAVFRRMEFQSERRSEEKKLEIREASSLIGQIMSDLQNNYRAALHLYYKEELTYGEIASIMKIPINTVKSHIYRGKEIIRKKITQADQLKKQPT
jgi:RNA polymerase sigma-70 factor (ECF subfamily)